MTTNGVYLGEFGCIELQRVTKQQKGPDLIVGLTRGDVNATFNSLSFDPFNIEFGQLSLTTGDRIGMTTRWQNPEGATVVEFDDRYPLPNSLPDGVYKNVELVSRTGSGYGADIAELTIKNGKIQKEDGTGDAVAASLFATGNDGAFYNVGDYLTLSTDQLGKTGIDARLKVHTITKAESTLWFLDGSPVYATYYVHVSRAGNISFHETFDDALAGKGPTRIPLQAPVGVEELTIYIEFANGFRRPLAQVSEFTINTSREFVDTTSLGKEYVEKYEAGEITGSGSMKCQWNFRSNICTTSEPAEFVHYLAQVLLRTEVGSEFASRFFLYYNPEDKSAWYDCPSCLVQKVGVSVSPDQIIHMDVEFLMSGPFSLQTGRPPSYLLIEDLDESYVYQEDKSAGFEVELYENEDD